ncbi:MAG: vitamin B12-dependent ribonucleotide reductase [Phycisphaerae bacterium]|nr:vitamin B12-dependent ribonucleotide reductase [Phycisphaerae bacterium]
MPGCDKDSSKTASKGSAKLERKAIPVERFFSTQGVNPFDQIEWDYRTATITDDKGNIVFEQKNVEVPDFFSQLATKVVVSKYFYGEQDTDERETSFRQLVHRVARTIADWGLADGLFVDEEQCETFYNELAWLCVNQYGAFNSPVWFNVGLHHVNGVSGSPHNFYWNQDAQEIQACPNSYEFPQASACFIQNVGDTMEDIMALATSEAMLFKHGSGTGTDLSTLRSSREKLSGGGKPSGPLSFMRVFDQIAGVIKSGGKTRRAAKMQSLKIHHPDIREFITCKTEEEKKAWALIEQGYSGDYNGNAYGSIMFQNANLSVRLTDDFMKAVETKGKFNTIGVTDGKPVEELDADEIMHLIAEGTHVCGDPGVQYDTIINNWHTCKNTGRINASNPCSEYMFVDNSACNLASLNLMKFRNADGSFNVEAMKRAVRIFIIAQEILVDRGSYPTAEIAKNSHEYRPLGLGYANLGSLLMSLGLPYDSEEGRAMAGAITSVMTGHAYCISSEIAKGIGPFVGHEANADCMLDVIKMHRDQIKNIDKQLCPENLLTSAQQCWDQAVKMGKANGYRNAQVTVLAPTGTIGFLMDCDTTGVEPDIALVKYKLLAGGGMLKIVNQTVPMALKRLGYDEQQVAFIVASIEKNDTIENSEELKNEHLPVFDCAFKPANGVRAIDYLAHIKMMAATQPFISGAISKTVNMPKECSVEDIKDAYIVGWELGLKALAIYRDGSKRSQPLNTKKITDKKKEAVKSETAFEPAEIRPQRRRLPQTRRSITHKFDVAGHEGYLTVGLYEDGSPGEIFITMAKEGSTVGGLMDTLGTCISMALQYGVPLEAFITKFSHARFEPAGMTSNRDIPFAKSLVDYIARWLAITFQPTHSDAAIVNREGNSESPKRMNVWDDRTKDDPAAKTGKKKLADIGNRLGKIIDAVNHPASEKFAAAAVGGNDVEVLSGQFSHFQEDAPVCDCCGSITVRNGNCYRCFNCGASLGCS